MRRTFRFVSSHCVQFHKKVPNLVIPNLVIPNLVMPNLVIHFYSPTLNLPIPYHKQHNLSRKQQFGTKKFNVKTVTPY
jgi:hypothetical protein